ncbi:MAG: DUF87 domain-containing protein [Bryobacterales bacterium]|nr:DUF87 domain-containing protein [Bryobacterales bacterium]
MTESIGRVVEVHGFRVKIELDRDHRSPIRAGLDGATTQVKVNAFVTFAIGAGEDVLGIITDLYAREVFEPEDQRLSLELVRPRRSATVQLLGVVRSTHGGQMSFDPGVTILPTLDTPARPAAMDMLETVLERAPIRNRPDGWSSEEPFDTALVIGSATAASDRTVVASYNDLFSRPLAVVGNTGSGKSCTIATFLQSAAAVHGESWPRPRFFILDLNGEYAQAMGVPEPSGGKQPNRIYVNGHEATVPMWLMNAHEVCQWLSAAEQTQQPALVNLWALAKGAQASVALERRDLQAGVTKIGTMLSWINEPGMWQKGKSCFEAWNATLAYLPWIREESGLEEPIAEINRILAPARRNPKIHDRSFGTKEVLFRNALLRVSEAVERRLDASPTTIEQTADKPVHFHVSTLDNAQNLETAAELAPGDRGIRQFLQGLQLRIQNRRNDRRWHPFYNYDALGVTSIGDWLSMVGIGNAGSAPTVVIDCSMLGHDVLPYVCGIIGRVLLEVREHAVAVARFREPWVIVLEEAHNYVRPRRQDESKGISVSRETFERIAKEGRKFGLSLIAASQRPSDVSATVLSQCANFVVHRLQNPEDIDHFRKIVPSRSRRLMDQITILAPGEAVVVGSAFNVPTRARIQLPDPVPASPTSSPFVTWAPGSEPFDIDQPLNTWIGRDGG